MDGVGAPGRPEDDGRGVDLDCVAFHLDREPIHALRRRTQLVLPGAVVLRAVARALEPLALLAEGDPTSEMGALLIERHQALLNQTRIRGVAPGTPECVVV